MYRVAFAALALLLACSAPASASTWKWFNDGRAKAEGGNKQIEAYLDAYMKGLFDGLLHRYSWQVVDGQKQTACIPGELQRNQLSVLGFIKRGEAYYVRKRKEKVPDDTPVALLLTFGVEDTFPCR